MNKTKFWAIGNNLFTNKYEAEYIYMITLEKCFCRKLNTFSMHHICCEQVRELDIETVVKDKKYKQFLDKTLENLIYRKESSMSKTASIENEIQDIKKEQETLK